MVVFRYIYLQWGNEYRVEELRHRLMKLSIMTLDNDEREVLDYWGEEWD